MTYGINIHHSVLLVLQGFQSCVKIYEMWRDPYGSVHKNILRDINLCKLWLEVSFRVPWDTAFLSLFSPSTLTKLQALNLWSALASPKPTMVLDIYGGPPPVAWYRSADWGRWNEILTCYRKQMEISLADEMYRKLQAEVWAYETEGAFN